MSGLPPVAPLGAVQFLTRVPIRLRAAPDLAACVPWFPIVGAAIGASVGAVVAGLMELVPALVAAAVGVVFGVVLTGAFHEDGLADTADALGGWSPEQRREILKDSRHGSYGVVAMCSTVVIRVVCVASLGPAVAFAGLVAAHTLGRGAAVAVMGTAPPVPTSGLGADYARGLTPSRTAVGVIAALVIAAAATGWWAVPLAGAAAVGAVMVAVIAHRAFGGASGDVLGAVEQVGENLVLIVVTGLALRHPLWWA
ncbi:MAG TPA: adenosylcobinamide-GDP ribazoletransferase [Ilumatobacteraceae bacterium]|nr:adenosylcobinamide-GDP ribazoletransferase [Ilumatobacteraceae bacterium]